jgi:CDP-glycerol glycerophosphotransferase (TagB/SpsB family)
MCKRVKDFSKLLIRVFFYLLMDIVWLLSYIVSKDKSVWIFGSWFGEKFADNSKYLYLYINKYHPEIRAIWLSRNNDLINKLREKGYEAYKTYSIKGFIYSMKAYIVIIDNSLTAVNRFSIAKSKIIQLWHGSPLKKIGYDDIIFTNRIHTYKSFKSFFILIWHKIFPFLNEKYDMAIATSKLTQTRLSSAFKIPADKVLITGYPRNDILLRNNESSPFLDKIKKGRGFKYLFFYLPTFRGEINSSFDLFSNYNFNFKEIEEFLSELNGLLLIKTHPVNSIKNQALLAQVSGSKLIKIVGDFDIDGDIYPLLSCTDVLITDYSSVYFDYLLLNRPIIFAPFDIDEYIRKDREFYDSYYDVTPGPKAKSWDEVLVYIKEAIEEPEKYKTERERINKMFNQYQDANSSERVYQAIMERFYREAK